MEFKKKRMANLLHPGLIKINAVLNKLQFAKEVLEGQTSECFAEQFGPRYIKQMSSEISYLMRHNYHDNQKNKKQKTNDMHD